jgi:hypothetical protein
LLLAFCVGMDSFHGADFLCESLSDLSFNLDAGGSKIEDMFSHMPDLLGSGNVAESYIEDFR